MLIYDWFIIHGGVASIPLLTDAYQTRALFKLSWTGLSLSLYLKTVSTSVQDTLFYYNPFC